MKVLDGDTILALYGGRKISIRLHGIDAPETRQKSFEGIFIGDYSTAALKEMIASKKGLWLKSHGEDVYGRTLGTLYGDPKGEIDYNFLLLARGLVLLYPHSQFHSLKGKRKYIFAFQRAKARQRGIWSVDGFLSPRFYRKRVRRGVED